MALLFSIVLMFWATIAMAQGFPRAKLPQKPFWEKKERIYQKMIDERAIYVSVKTEKTNKDKVERLKILGAGVIHRPRETAWRAFTQFGHWSEIHESIRESRWVPSSKRLFLHMEAFNYHAKMILNVEVENLEQEDWIHMKVVQGSFAGMTVAFRLKDAKGRKTEVAMTALYEFEKLPMPQFFVVFGLEVVFQKIAGKMRLFIEREGTISKEDAA